MTVSAPPVRPGEVLAGKYRVERVLGEGGMGVVVAATHLQLDQRVAIKFLRSSGTALPAVMERFAREARAAAKIRNEHVARVLDVDMLADGSPYIVMEYLEGRDLAAILQDRHRLPVDEACAYVLQACEGVAEAHARGVVHRDLKPANLFLTVTNDGSECVKVLDFGISKTSGGIAREEFSLTGTAAMLGSPLYMPPEQMSSARNVDSRADVWSLGAVLYELVTGVAPFVGESVHEVVALIMHGPPAPMSSHGAEVPPGLEEVVFGCLEKDRERRIAGVRQLALALVPFLSDHAGAPHSLRWISRAASSAPPPHRSSGPPLLSPPSPTVAAWGTTSAGESRRRYAKAAGIGVLFAAAVAAVVAAALLIHRTAQPGRAAASPMDPPSAVRMSPSAPAAAVEPLPNAAMALSPLPADSLALPTEATPSPEQSALRTTRAPAKPAGPAVPAASIAVPSHGPTVLKNPLEMQPK